MPKRKNSASPEKTQLTIFLNTIASAWFIAGIITPSIISTTLNFSIIFRGTMSLMLSIITLILTIKLAKTNG